MEKQGVFDMPIFKTKITSANVKYKEMALGYFIGPFLAFISNAVLGSYLNRYYSDVIGWTDTSKFGLFSAMLPIISVIFVIMGNLVVGRLIDRTRTSQGKARPFLLISAPLVVVSIALLFLTPYNSSPTMQMVWISLSYNMYYAVTYPLFYTAHSSMVALSTRNSNQRTMLATFSNASGVAAVGMAASILVPVFLQKYLFVSNNGVIDRVASYNNWRIFMLILCLITFIAIIIEYFFTRERITEETLKLGIKEEKISMKKQISACVHNKYWWIIITYFLLFQLGGLIKNGSMSYYSRWVFDSVTNEASAGAAMGTIGMIGGIPTALGMVFVWPLATKFGKKNCIRIGLVLAVLGGLVSFVDIHSLNYVCLGIFLKSIGAVPAMYVSLALLSDVLDHLEAKNGFRSDGFTMSVYGAIMVGLVGLGNGVINTLLAISGYDPLATVQNDNVISMLVFCFIGIELICYAILAILIGALNVEKHIEEEQATILEAQKQAVLVAGREWIEPEERLRREQEEAEQIAEENRIAELRAACEKKGKSFEEEEAKYQAKIAKKKTKAKK